MRLINYIFVLVGVLFICCFTGCSKKTVNDIPSKDENPSISTEVEIVVFNGNGSFQLPFTISGFTNNLNYNVDSPDCQIELRSVKDNKSPKFFKLSKVIKKSDSNYEALIVKNSDDEIFKEGAKLVLKTKNENGTTVIYSTIEISFTTEATVEGINNFKFLSTKNKELMSDVTLDFVNGSFVGNTPNYISSTNLIATFSCNNVVKVNGVVQESGVTVNDFSAPIEYVVESKNGKSYKYTVDLTNFTGLPVVVIDTKGIPITSKEDYIAGDIFIDGMGQYPNFEQSTMQIRGRGNSTWGWPKKPYAIKLDSKQSVLGMPKHKRWVLLANFMDRTMIRNAVTYTMGSLTSLAWTPRFVLVEVVLNNKHIGNYMLIEQIKVDKNRVDIADDGYLLELDFHYDNEIQWLSPWGRCNNFNAIPFGIKHPDEDEILNEQVEWVKDFIDNKVAPAVYSYKYNKDELDYSTYLDLQSFADYYLVFECAINHELGNPGSVYMHFNKGDKIFAGPLWDFDWGTYSYNASPHAKNSLIVNNAIWYAALFKDPNFEKVVKERWRILKPRFLSVANYILQMKEYLKISAEYNFKLWNPAEDASQNGGNIINGDENLSFQEAVDRMYEIYIERIKTIDNIIGQ